MYQKTIFDENREYWSGRAAGYSEVNREELATDQRRKWKSCLGKEILRQFSGRAPGDIHVLEIGTGPGFFPYCSARWALM